MATYHAQVQLPSFAQNFRVPGGTIFSLHANGGWYDIYGTNINGTLLVLSDPALNALSSPPLAFKVVESWAGSPSQSASMYGQASISPPTPLVWLDCQNSVSSFTDAVALMFSHCADTPPTHRYDVSVTTSPQNKTFQWLLQFETGVASNGNYCQLFFSWSFWYAFSSTIKSWVFNGGVLRLQPMVDVVLQANRRNIWGMAYFPYDDNGSFVGTCEATGVMMRKGNPSCVIVTPSQQQGNGTFIDQDIDLQNGQAIYTVLGRTFTRPGQRV